MAQYLVQRVNVAGGSWRRSLVRVRAVKILYSGALPKIDPRAYGALHSGSARSQPLEPRSGGGNIAQGGAEGGTLGARHPGESPEGAAGANTALIFMAVL